MKMRDWLDSLTKEQLASWLRLGGVTYQICMGLLEENNFKIGVKERYSFVENMTR